MFNTESRHLLNLSIYNALDCIPENFSLKNFPGGACIRNSPEKCAIHSPHGRYCAHIATVYYISRLPLSQNPLSAPVHKFLTSQLSLLSVKQTHLLANQSKC